MLNARGTPSRKRAGERSTISRVPLVGRTAALEALSRRELPAAIVLGEMGSGKSRLLAEAREHSESKVFTVACERGASLLPLEPLVSLVRAVHREGFLPTATREAVLGAAERDRLSFIREALETAARVPMVFQIDDLHWADEGTPDALRYCIDRLQDMPISWQITSRTGAARVEAFAYDLERAALAERVTLDGLTIEDLARLVALIRVESQPSDAALKRLYERTAGNPLYAELLITAECIEGPDIPRTLRWALHERLTALSVEAADIAAWIAIHRGPLQQSAIAALSRYSPAQVLTALTELLDKGILRRSQDGYAFRHELLLDVCYESMQEEVRARRHEALAHRTQDDWQRAGHFDGARRYEEAASVLIKIGWDRLDRDAPTEALTAFERSLERLNPDSEGAWEARAGLAAASYTNGNIDFAHARMREFEERAAGLGARLRVLARGRFAEAVWRTKQDAGVTMPTIEAAIAEARREAPDMLARLLGVFGGACERLKRLDDARHALEEALRNVDPRIHQREAIRLHTLLGLILGRLGNARDGISQVEAAARRADELGLTAEFTTCCVTLCHLSDMAADAERFEYWCRRGLGVEGPKSRRSQAQLMISLSHVAVDKGRLHEALGLAIAAASTADPATVIATQAHCQQANVYAMLGDSESAHRALAEARVRETKLSWQPKIDYIAAIVAELDGDYEEALSFYERSAGNGETLDEVYQLRALVGIVKMAYLRGDASLASRTLVRLRNTNRLGWGLTTQLVHEAESYVKLVQGDIAGGCNALTQAAAEELDAFCKTEMLLRVADLRGDRELFMDVIDAFDALGAVRAADKARALARAHGLRPGRKREQHGALSERELTVAHLVASGKTNSEIGELLHVSPRTVEFHLGNILSKCGLRSRVEIAIRVAAGTLVAIKDQPTTA